MEGGVMDIIAICDDCEKDRKRMAEQIKKNEEYRDDMEIQLYSSGRLLLEAMDNIHFSAIILDVMMDGMDGEETARKIREKENAVLLAFYTGGAFPTSNSFLIQSYRYMFKSMKEDEISRQISDILIKMKADRSIPSLWVKAVMKLGSLEINIKLDAVVLIDKCKGGLIVHITQSAKHLLEKQYSKGELSVLKMKDTLDAVYERIKNYGFGRPHDSYVINFRYMESCSSKEFKMSGRNDFLGISKSRCKEFMKHKDLFINSKYEKEGTV